MERSDEMLAVETLKGNAEAFETLVTRYQKSVFKIVYRMVGQREDAEDISQEVFLTVYKKMYQFDPSKKFAPWLYRVAVNTCISRLRRKNKVVMINFDDNLSRHNEFINSEYIDPMIKIEREEIQKHIFEALQQMPEGYRAMIILRYQLDLTNSEISETIGISKENVEVRMHRARKMLRSLLLQTLEEGRETYELPTSK